MSFGTYLWLKYDDLLNLIEIGQGTSDILQVLVNPIPYWIEFKGRNSPRTYLWRKCDDYRFTLCINNKILNKTLVFEWHFLKPFFPCIIYWIIFCSVYVVVRMTFEHLFFRTLIVVNFISQPRRPIISDAYLCVQVKCWFCSVSVIAHNNSLI